MQSPQRLWIGFSLLLALLALGCVQLLRPFLEPALEPILDAGEEPTVVATEPASPQQVAVPSPTAASPAEPQAPTETPSPQPPEDPPTPTPRQPNEQPTQPRIPQRVLDIMQRVEQQVIEIRGLKPLKPVERRFLTREELRKRVEEDFFADFTPEEARQDVLELWVFGFLERDFDLYTFFRDLYSEVIAGFYDDEEQAMYVVAQQGFPPHARLTYAHEFAHALQDQTWDFDEGLGYTDERCEQDTEYCAGLQALIEGDATLVELEWFWTKATAREQAAIRRYYQNLDNPTFDQAPAFFQEDLLFPYDQGLEFVRYLYNRGGWEAVNQAYENPPRSTEQILHPERYPNDLPQRVQLPDLPALLGEGWEPIVEYNALGEFWLYLLLRYPLRSQWAVSESRASLAAEGWGGDAYAVYYNPETDAVVLTMDIRWDTTEDAREFLEAFMLYAEERFGVPRDLGGNRYFWNNTPYGAVWFSTRGNRSLWLIAPDEELLTRLRNAFNP